MMNIALTRMALDAAEQGLELLVGHYNGFAGVECEQVRMSLQEARDHVHLAFILLRHAEDGIAAQKRGER